LAETGFIIRVVWDEAEAYDIGQGNPGASPHGGEDNPKFLEARRRGVHVEGHWLEFGSRVLTCKVIVFGLLLGLDFNKVILCNFAPVWEVAAGPLIELDAEGCALDGQYRGRGAFTVPPWLANGAAYGVDLFVGKVG
jgi:hypothetical protein